MCTGLKYALKSDILLCGQVKSKALSLVGRGKGEKERKRQGQHVRNKQETSSKGNSETSSISPATKLLDKHYEGTLAIILVAETSGLPHPHTASNCNTSLLI